ncbi:hypothetical protein ACHMW6_06295 [Pseudoduganella sp. UC29_106]|uniref:hypothetical protein n=1 Tax=Pseudoduganella sp. UC29_106 TaxID=3374553 RepID=UPI003757B50F
MSASELIAAGQVLVFLDSTSDGDMFERLLVASREFRVASEVARFNSEGPLIEGDRTDWLAHVGAESRFINWMVTEGLIADAVGYVKFGVYVAQDARNALESRQLDFWLEQGES